MHPNFNELPDHWHLSRSFPKEKDLREAKDILRIFHSEDSLDFRTQPGHQWFQIIFRPTRVDEFEHCALVFRALYFLAPDVAAAALASLGSGYHGYWSKVIEFLLEFDSTESIVVDLMNRAFTLACYDTNHLRSKNLYIQWPFLIQASFDLEGLVVLFGYLDNYWARDIILAIDPRWIPEVVRILVVSQRHNRNEMIPLFLSDTINSIWSELNDSQQAALGKIGFRANQ